jgi:hypothetical protein
MIIIITLIIKKEVINIKLNYKINSVSNQILTY